MTSLHKNALLVRKAKRKNQTNKNYYHILMDTALFSVYYLIKSYNKPMRKAFPCLLSSRNNVYRTRVNTMHVTVAKGAQRKVDPGIQESFLKKAWIV